jgi:large subunit ribosomal protein L25
MAHQKLQAAPRTIVGKKVKVLRRQGLLPANVYGHNVPSQPLQVDGHEFTLLQRHLSSSSIIDLTVDGGAVRPVMIHRTQRDFKSGRPNHIEFFQINMSERLTASVPLVLVGESEAVRRGDGIIMLQELDTIEITCLPADLPGSIEVSITDLAEPGDVIRVRDLHVDRSKIEIRTHEDDRVVSIAAAQMRAEDLEADAAVAEEAAQESAEAPQETEDAAAE